MKAKNFTVLGSVLVLGMLYAQDIQVTDKWQLLGALEDISSSSFDGKCVDFVWTYDNGWQVHIANGNSYNIPSNITKFDTINKGQGFWVKGNSSCEFNINDYPKTENLTQEVKDSLAYMGNEERLAYDVYMNLYDYYQKSGIEIKQFYNISTMSEVKHIATVQDLVKKYNLSVTDFTDVNETIVNDNNMSSNNMPSGVYDIAKIQELYDTLYAMGQESQESALKVGCMVEVTDINDLDEYIKQAQNSNAQDVVEAFEFLRNGSYNHYWAFDKALKNLGVTNGCYYEGDELLTNKEGVYPKNEKGGKGRS